MKILDHSSAKVERLWYKWFGCTKCGYNCYSKKWVREHILDMIKMQICGEGGMEFGWFNYIEIKEKCKTCWVKEACEAFKLKRDIALMQIQGNIFFKNPNIEPLMGLGSYIKHYETKIQQLNKVLHFCK